LNLKGPKSRFPPFPLEDGRKVVVCGGSRDDSLSAEADVRRERSTRLERWSDVSKVTGSDVCSGRSLVSWMMPPRMSRRVMVALLIGGHGRERGIGGGGWRETSGAPLVLLGGGCPS